MIKILAICDSEASYCLKMDIYTGKEASEARTTNLGYNAVMRLIKPSKLSGRNITRDNFS